MSIHFRGDVPRSFQVAQSQLPIFLLDQSHQSVVEETWLTIVMDSYSTAIAGYALSDVHGEEPLHVALDLAYDDRKRIEKLQKLSEKDLSWGIGNESTRILEVPNKLQKASIKKYAADHDLLLQGRSQGGSTSKFFATLKSQVLLLLPGVYDLEGKPRQRQRAIKTASLTTEKLDRIILLYISSVFNKRQTVWDFSKSNLGL